MACGVVISPSRPPLMCVDGSILIHSVFGELLHEIAPSSSHLSHPHLVRVTSSGLLVVHYADQKGCLAVYNSNGKQLSRLPLEGPALVKLKIANFIHSCLSCSLFRHWLLLKMEDSLSVGASTALSGSSPHIT